jgi:outer membrane protein assembly factor BamB
MFHHDPQHTGLSQFDTSANSGALKWSFALASDTCTVPFVSSSPPAIAADGTVYVGYSLGKTNSCPVGGGNLLWAIKDGGVKWSSVGVGISVDAGVAGLEGSPAVGPDGTIYVAVFAPARSLSLYAINPDGSQKWRRPYSVSSSPTVGADGTIYTSSGAGVVAIDPDGNTKWTFASGSTNSSPAVGADGTVYVSSGGGLYALDPAGNQKWTFASGSTNSSPAVGADGTVYVSSGGGLYALDPAGNQKWNFTGGSGDPAFGPDGTIYVSSVGGDLIAINPDGSLKWTSKGNGGAPAVGADGTIYVSSNGNPAVNLIAINPDGSLKWTSDANGGTSPVIGADGTIYVGSGASLYAIGDLVALSPELSFFAEVGLTSPAMTATLANEQLVALNISDITTSGDFQVSSTTCGTSLRSAEPALGS